MNALDERLLPAMDVLSTPIWLYDIDLHRIYWANQAALTLWEASHLAELCQRDFSFDMATSISLLLKRYLGEFQSGRSYSEWWTITPKGIKKQLYLRLSGVQVAGRLMMMTESVIDADTLYHEVSLVSRDRLACIFDGNGGFENGNDHFQMCFGKRIRHLNQLLSLPDPDFFQKLANIEELVTEELCQTVKGMRWFVCQFRYIQQGAKILLTLKDITERKTEELKHRHLASHDSLTGLLNRYGLITSLENYCQVDQHFALLFIDLDNFKLINDNFGHKAGDRLLEQVADRLQYVCPADVELARLGGDEFTLLVPLAEHAERAYQMAELILSQMVAPIKLPGLPEMTVGCSIGLAIYPDDAQDGENLMMRADMAMYQAKQAGRLRWLRFMPSMGLQLQRKLMLRQKLSKAIAQQEFTLFYQPQIDTACAHLIGYEALLRWHNPELGEVAPSEFIPLAEEMGLICEIGNWVLEQAIAQIAHWQKYFDRRVPLSVNLSGFQLSYHLPSHITQLLSQYDVDSELLTIELTETVLMFDMQGGHEIVKELGVQGINVAIDDFGAGYSALSYLNRLAIDTIKLDRSFVTGLNLPVIKAIVAMANSLGLRIMVEGVEHPHELVQLQAQGCELFQGYLFSKALSVAQLEEMNFSVSSEAHHYSLKQG